MPEKPDDIIKKIQEALSRDGQEVSASHEKHGNADIISINRKPAGESTWYSSPDGSTIVY